MTRAQSAKKLDYALVALADPKRRAMLRRLAQGEARVTELAAPFDVSLNAISKHIKLLERAGLVQRRRIGREHLLRLELGADERPAHNKLNTDHSDRISVHANDQDSRTVRAFFFTAVLCVSALSAFR